MSLTDKAAPHPTLSSVFSCCCCVVHSFRVWCCSFHFLFSLFFHACSQKQVPGMCCCVRVA